MSEITIFLLFLIAILAPANAFLQLSEKRSKRAKLSCNTSLLKTRKASSLQANETQAIQQQLMQLNEQIRKNNGFRKELNKLKGQQESIHSKVLAIEGVTFQVQNDLNKIKAPASLEHAAPKQGQEKTNRVKILEEYLKKV